MATFRNCDIQFDNFDNLLRFYQINFFLPILTNLSICLPNITIILHIAYFWREGCSRISKIVFPCVKHANTKIQLHKHINTQIQHRTNFIIHWLLNYYDNPDNFRQFFHFWQSIYIFVNFFWCFTICQFLKKIKNSTTFENFDKKFTVCFWQFWNFIILMLF